MKPRFFDGTDRTEEREALEKIGDTLIEMWALNPIGTLADLGVHAEERSEDRIFIRYKGWSQDVKREHALKTALWIINYMDA